jgi:hypothetical protein
VSSANGNVCAACMRVWGGRSVTRGAQTLDMTQSNSYAPSRMHHACARCACAAEFDVYRVNCFALEHLTGARLPPPQSLTFNSIPVAATPRVSWSPAWAATLTDVVTKVAPGSVSLAAGAVLQLDGADITVEGPLHVRGAACVCLWSVVGWLDTGEHSSPLSGKHT